MQPAHFGRWLKRAIEDLGLSQRKFADQSEIPFQSLRRWISDSCPPIRGYNIGRLARALGLKREEIEEKLADAESAQGAGVAA